MRASVDQNVVRWRYYSAETDGGAEEVGWISVIDGHIHVRMDVQKNGHVEGWIKPGQLVKVRGRPDGHRSGQLNKKGWWTLHIQNDECGPKMCVIPVHPRSGCTYFFMSNFPVAMNQELTACMYLAAWLAISFFFFQTSFSMHCTMKWSPCVNWGG